MLGILKQASPEKALSKNREMGGKGLPMGGKWEEMGRKKKARAVQRTRFIHESSSSQMELLTHKFQTYSSLTVQTAMETIKKG